MYNKLYNYNGWDDKGVEKPSPQDYADRVKEIMGQFYNTDNDGTDEVTGYTASIQNDLKVGSPVSINSPSIIDSGKIAPAPAIPLLYPTIQDISSSNNTLTYVSGVTELEERVEELETLVAELQATIEKLNNQLNPQGKPVEEGKRHLDI